MANLIYKGSKANLPADRNATSFYLCEDNRELYFGANLYTEPVRFYATTKPATPAQGVLYIDTVTGAGDAWDGTAWKNVIKAYAVTIDENADDTTVPTSKAVKDYVGAEISKIPAQTDYTVTVTESTPEGYAKAYTITQAATGLNTVINIPKDMVVESGTVVTDPAGQPAGTYLKLVLANANEDEIFINVGDLIEYVTSGSQAGDQIMVAVSADHKVTATLSNGSVTLAQLAQEVQDEIAKAHTHDNKALLDTYTQTETDLKDAVDKKHTHANAAELDKIADGDKAKWDTAAGKAHDHANKTELDKFADGDKAKLDAAVEAQHEHANAAELDLIETGDKAKWDAAVEAVTVGTF